MAVKTGITWATATWNPWWGCHKVSQGCKFCYAERDVKRYGHDFNLVRKASVKTFRYPSDWYRSKSLEYGSRIFTCSWSDWFIDEADPWRDEAWWHVKNTPYIYLILTKRIDKAIQKLPTDWGDGYANVWLGTSVESKEYLGRLDYLADIPAVVHFVSAEPLLGGIDFTYHLRENHIQWMITGGESGVGVRPMPKGAAEAIINDCRRFNVPVFHKQNGGSSKVDGVWGGDHIMGRVFHEFPAPHPRTTEFIERY